MLDSFFSAMTRRSFLLRAGFGIGTLSLAEAMGLSQVPTSGTPGILRAGHFPARAKRVTTFRKIRRSFRKSASTRWRTGCNRQFPK
jgi:hypothetical protein